MLQLTDVNFAYWCSDFYYSGNFADDPEVNEGFGIPIGYPEWFYRAHSCLIAQAVLAMTGALEEF
jgi:hypothetical protein